MMLAKVLVSYVVRLPDTSVAALPSGGAYKESVLTLLVASVGLLLML